MGMQIREIKDLIKIVDESEITEFILEDQSGGVKITIRKPSAAVPVAAPPVVAATAPEASPTAKAVTEGQAVAGEEDEFSDPKYATIKAPMVGTFYRAPSPDAEPYVKVGDHVELGQALCIIEAMKLMNEIESEVKGRIVKILVENAQPVEYGQSLFVVERE